MVVLAGRDVARVLVVVAHPDDAEFWAGGTIACWTGAGVAVTYLVLTDGDQGGWDPGVPRAAIPGIRRAEQEQAARVLGVREVRFLGLREGGIHPGSPWLGRELVRAIRQVRPQRVLTWSPEWNWQRFRSCHPDHRATGEAVLRAVYPAAGNPFAYPELAAEGLPPWTVAEAWLLNSPQPDHYVDVTGTFQRTLAAVGAHRSQVGHRTGAELARMLRQRLAANAEAAGLPAGRLAEAFQLVATG